MNTDTTYCEVGLQEWEQAAQLACFQSNLQLKSKAQYFFFMFAQNPNTQLLIEIVDHGSNTLLFVIFSYLTKNQAIFPKNINSLVSLTQSIGRWELKGFTFIRQDSFRLQEYVTRTIMLALGIFLKRLYQNEQTEQNVLVFLQELEQSYFKLYLLRSVIDAVELIDYQIGYISHRTLVYSFQDNIIPYICEVLIPQFYKIQQNIQIHELSHLHQSLRVSEQSISQLSNGQQRQLTSSQQIHANYIFLLLKKVFEFNFNISYPEYQNEQMIEPQLITFPDSVIQKIINSQFIRALFFIIQRIIDNKVGLKNQQYLFIGVDCVAKIMQSKIATLQQSIKEGVIASSIIGLTNMLQKCQQIKNSRLLEAILICNKKLLIGCQLQFIKHVFHKHQSNVAIYDTYIKDLTSIIILITQQSTIQCDNHLLLQGLELSNKILISYGYQDQESMEEGSLFFIEFAKQVVRTFLKNLLFAVNIFGNKSFCTVGDNKAMVTQLFQHFKKIATYNYTYFLNYLQDCLRSITDRESYVGFANMLFLLSQITDKGFLEKSPFLNKASNRSILVLGRIIQKSTNLVKFYLENRNGRKESYLELSIILFTQSIISQFLLNFQLVKTLKIKNKVYLSMVFPEDQFQSKKNEDTKSQQILVSYIRFIIVFIQQYISERDQQRMLYLLGIVQRIIFRLKWHSRRQAYLRSEIFKVLQNLISFLFNKPKLSLTVRSWIAKILVTLTFDDILDQYKFRINKFLLANKSQSNVSIVYNLIGAFEGIQTFVVSRYFYNTLKKFINMKNFFNQVFEEAYGNNQLLKDVCKLVRCMVNNKGLKVSNNHLAYQIFQTILPNIIQLLSRINSKSIDMDIVCDCLCQIIQMINVAVNGTHLNVFLVEQNTQLSTNNLQSNSYLQLFFIEMFAIIATIMPGEIKMYPQLNGLVLIFCNSINRELLGYILGSTNKQMVMSYKQIHLKQIERTIQCIKQILNGSKNLQQQLSKFVDALKFFFIYCFKSSRIIHKKINIQNIKQVLNGSINAETGQNNNQILVFYLLSFLFKNENYSSLFRSIAKTLYWIHKIFNQCIINSAIKLNASASVINGLKIILENQDEDGFVGDLRSWLKGLAQKKKNI